ncbi:Outer membrane protein assembly factor BamE [Ferriphaselus amnicola]|uniref:Outer membrane protein assembly factor BamE n=1 Tax=Ferriphaselus amnicola TaxID=1188319 RepID=A0A2Z6GEY3_9PROT|nr:outer membrane protein assembly factor BamE [Ferriphaselus amnicola]BBE51909.1 Outer membrane protein assembly factor BamE [Ferriphaselus amnicola]
MRPFLSSLADTMRFLLLILTLLLASCSGVLTPHMIEIRQGNVITPEMRERVKIGMTRLQVKAALGTPMIADPFHANRWDYVYRLEQEGELVGQTRLTAYFEDEVLVRLEDGPTLGAKQ